MRVLGSTVLVFEAIVVLLAIPIAINVSDANATFALVIGIALAGLLILTVGVITKPIAVPIGWILQVLVIAAGIVVPTMFLVGGIFALLWFYAVRNGQRVDRARELPES
ncbi:MAG: DUF4233 domain-containing protein [Candidatus Nanopelagicales bacterium]|jgi:hypothetical protein|nr:DUF4233 domain-containing protein [Actinomycetes bacterium]MCH9831436.1 DUF4233 domain-containing protein [Actinomycetes bacterium]MCH9841373.1 DUF4233 domain-containing protein [Actinomycetes bacterium]